MTLRCEYDLGDMNLYSVKWYKDGSEFFRYMPDYDPRSQAVKNSGITVDVSIFLYFFIKHKTQRHPLHKLQYYMLKIFVLQFVKV